MSPRYRSRVSNAKGNAHVCDESEATTEQIDKEVRKLLDDAYELARRALTADSDKLDVITKVLLEHETLDNSQVKEIVEHGRLINPAPREGPLPDKKMPVESPLASLGLTAREAEVLTWIAQGKSNYE